MRRTWSLLLLMLVGFEARAHDVSLELTGSATGTSVTNPRTGSLGATAGGSFDFNDAWSAFASLGYTKDLPTRTADTSSSGANIFLISAGALFIPSDHFMILASGHFSPQVVQENATTVTFGRTLKELRDFNVTVRNTATSGGATLLGGWFSGGSGRFTHAIDASASFTSYSTFEQWQVPSTPAGLRLRAACGGDPPSDAKVCTLVTGADSHLVQARLGARYTLTINSTLDVGLEGAGFLYSQDPNTVGYFTLLATGRSPELGSGVPVAPYLVTGKVVGAYRFERLAFRLSYQVGPYVGSLGTNHLVALRTSFKVTPALKLTLLVSTQGDATSSGLANVGLMASLGSLFVF